MGGDYGYGNARIRGMKADLLDRRAYETLLAAASLEALIEALVATAYKEEIEAALVKHPGVECVAEGVRKNIARTTGSMIRFFDGRPQQLVGLLVSRWDLFNLIAILRGQARGVAAEEILATLVPAGALKDHELQELAKQPTVGATAQLMLSWRLPFAGALARSLRLAGGDLALVETELHRIRFRDALAALRGDENDMLVRDVIETEIDTQNLSLLIRLSSLADWRAALRARFGPADPAALLLDGGHLSRRRLAELMAATDIEAMLRILEGTVYGPALQARLGEYRQGADAAVLERALDSHLLLKGARMFHRDPLGVAMAVGYLWAKSAEVANLRLIAQGKALGWSPDAVRQEMIWWAQE